MKTYTLNQAKNSLIGKVGTTERDQYEFELKCELNKMKNEGKRIDTNKKPSKKLGGGTASNTKPTSEPKRPLDWDARDLKADGGLPKSGRSVEGRYTNRFWEED